MKKVAMFVVRCKSSISGNWTTNFYESIERALYYVKVTKRTKYGADDVIFLTRESLNNCCVWSGSEVPEIWRFKK